MPPWKQETIPMRDPNCNASLATKPKKLPLRTQLFQHLQNHTGVYSPAGQPFLVFHPSGTSDNAGAFLLPVNSSTFRQHWLNLQLQSGNPIPSATTLRDATRALESKVFANSVGIAPVPTHIRLAWDRFSEPPSIVLALDTLHARHITITQNAWTPASTPNGFVYHPVQQPLPDPVESDEPEPILRKFQALLRLDDPNFETLQSWLLTALQPAKDPAFHDYPILNFTGPPDSGKTVAAKLITKLIDPTGTPLHSLPTTERRLHILASTHHLIAIDHPGRLSPEHSRRLERLAGGIASTYRHYEGMLVRPILLTTREPRETKHLAAKVVDVEFEPVTNPRTQAEILREFEALQPELLGALLTLLARQFEHPQPCRPNRKEKNQKIVESVTALLNQHDGYWVGTATELVQAASLPISPKAIGQFLRYEDHPMFEVEFNPTRTRRLIALIRL